MAPRKKKVMVTPKSTGRVSDFISQSCFGAGRTATPGHHPRKPSDPDGWCWCKQQQHEV